MEENEDKGKGCKYLYDGDSLWVIVFECYDEGKLMLVLIWFLVMICFWIEVNKWIYIVGVSCFVFIDLRLFKF